MGNERDLTFLGHLTELRNRLGKSAIALLVTVVICFIFAEDIFRILIAPAGSITLIYTEMTEMIGTYMKVSLIGGFILAMPFLTYQVVMFIFPALTSRERKYILWILPWIAVSFAGGVAFGYFVLVPPATNFLITFGADIATPQIKIGNYISIVSRLLIAIGLVFELPLVTTFLAKIGIVNSRWLASKRKGAIIFSFVLAALITPTFDPVNQIMVAVPLVILYEISIWLARLVQPKPVNLHTADQAGQPERKSGE